MGAKVELGFSSDDESVTAPAYERGVDLEDCSLGTNFVVPLGMMSPAVELHSRRGQKSST